MLVVDDEIDVAELFRQKFRREVRDGSIGLEFALSGEEALTVIPATDPPSVMLILSDINMPGMNGFQLLETVKTRWPQMPVMMISAYGDEESMARALQLGAEDLVAKPIDFATLKTRLLGLRED